MIALFGLIPPILSHGKLCAHQKEPLATTGSFQPSTAYNQLNFYRDVLHLQHNLFHFIVNVPS